MDIRTGIMSTVYAWSGAAPTNVSFCWKRRLQFERGHCLRAALIRPTNTPAISTTFSLSSDQRLLLYKGYTQIVASVSFEAMSLHVAAILILVSTVAASYMYVDFLMFEFVQVKTCTVYERYSGWHNSLSSRFAWLVFQRLLPHWGLSLLRFLGRGCFDCVPVPPPSL